MDFTLSQLAALCGWIAAIVGVGTMVVKAIQKPFKAIEEKLDKISKRLDDNDMATSTVMLEKMMWAYHTYCIQGEPIPLDVKTALEAMYDQYIKDARHNHIPADFKQRLSQCRVV